MMSLKTPTRTIFIAAMLMVFASIINTETTHAGENESKFPVIYATR